MHILPWILALLIIGLAGGFFLTGKQAREAEVVQFERWKKENEKLLASMHQQADAHTAALQEQVDALQAEIASLQPAVSAAVVVSAPVAPVAALPARRQEQTLPPLPVSQVVPYSESLRPLVERLVVTADLDSFVDIPPDRFEQLETLYSTRAEKGEDDAAIAKTALKLLSLLQDLQREKNACQRSYSNAQHYKPNTTSDNPGYLDRLTKEGIERGQRNATAEYKRQLESRVGDLRALSAAISAAEDDLRAKIEAAPAYAIYRDDPERRDLQRQITDAEARRDALQSELKRLRD